MIILDINSRVIFVHVPKCGGGTLISLIQDSCKFKDNLHGKRKSKGLSPVDRAAIFNKEYTREPMEVEDARIICGHFHYSTYLHLSENLITIIRNPIDRTISHYYDWLNKGMFEKAGKTPKLRNEVKKMKDILYFTKKFKNFMTRYYTGNDPKIYKYIGFLENYRESLEYLNNNFFSIDISQMNEVFQNKSYKEPVSKKIRSQMEKYLEKDFEFYEEALKGNWRN